MRVLEDERLLVQGGGLAVAVVLPGGDVTEAVIVALGFASLITRLAR